MSEEEPNGNEKYIDWEKVEFFTKSGAKQVNLCNFLQIDETTFRRRILERYGLSHAAFTSRLRSTGEMLIEGKQFQKAMSGNTEMLKHVGKHLCGQRDDIYEARKPPNQDDISKDHVIMQLQHELSELRSKLIDEKFRITNGSDDGNKCETESELFPGDSSV